jgi:hypothetical protein
MTDLTEWETSLCELASDEVVPDVSDDKTINREIEQAMPYIEVCDLVHSYHKVPSPA